MYKTTKEENETLTRTGRGTPMGEFLRRYWWPIGISAHLKSKPTFIRVFGEDLVLFRDATGKAGVIGAYCAHRRANLCLGDIERDGVRCRYHGWLYDTSGKVVQIPGEPADSPLKKQDIRLPSYPVEELGGLIFAYFGRSRRRWCRATIFSSARARSISPSKVFKTATGCNASRTAWIRCIRVSPMAARGPIS